MIVDAHHHVWRRADLPWLEGPMRPRIFGPYEPIRRDYPTEEYLADLAGTGVSRSVYVQANWAPEAYAEEAAFVAAEAERTGFPHAIVAYADVSVEDARDRFDRLARIPLVRGVRMQLHWHEEPGYRFAPRADLVADEAVARNVARLADYGFVFELQVFAAQAAHALRLVDACPATTFVLQHAGMLEDLSQAGIAAWREAMASLAARPNVVAKLSALGTFLRRLDPAHVAFVVRETLALFGPRRCLWGSNFPIEKLWTDYGALLDAHRAATAHLAPAEREAVFAGVATRVYRL